MSYRRPDTGNPELDRKLAAEDFEMLFPRLLEASTDQGFAVWLDKLALIDQDKITGWLRENWDALSHDRRVQACLRLRALRGLPR